MESAQNHKAQARDKDNKKETQRRSLNPGKSSKDLHGDSNGKRGHASEAFQGQGNQSSVGESTDAAIASIQKHRLPKSGSVSKGKSASKNKMSVSAGSTSKGKRGEVKTISDGEKWVQAQDKVSEIPVQAINDSINENKDPTNMNTRSKSKGQSQSKSVTKGKSSEKSKGKTAQKTSSKSKPKSTKKSTAKSAAKSVAKQSIAKSTSGKTSQAKKLANASGVKRAKISETDLTNDEETVVEEVKSVKKSNLKSNNKSRQSKTKQ